MKIINYIVISGIIACASCSSSKTIGVQSNSENIKWGVRWSYMDSIGNHFQGVSADRNCFPGFEQYENNYRAIAIDIFDRWGELQFSSTDFSENWICNDDQSLSYKEGTYIYRLVTETTTNPSKKDTISGQVVLYNEGQTTYNKK